MAKRKKNKHHKNIKEYTRLSQHQKKGSRLRTRLSTLPIGVIDWDRDLLPEFLWLAALSENFQIKKVHNPYYQFMDIIDEYWIDKTPPFGLLSDFALLRHRADEIWAKHESILIELFHEPIGRILALYPENPASWLIRPDLVEKGGHLDPEVELGRLRRLVLKLLPGRGGEVGHLRTLPLGRLLKHGSLKFPADLQIIDLMPRYPHGTTEEETKLVQSLCRAMMGSILPLEKRYESKEWPKYFWRHNLDLVPCVPKQLPIRGSRPITEKDLPAIEKILDQNVINSREYLDRVAHQYRYDLYSPEKDEILLGLLARIVRLYVLITREPNLWARDMSGIMLRCLVDTVITFSYLAEKGEEKDFKQFREYGEGQEKLLMLHLQDSHPKDESLEGRNSEAISQELGGFLPEIIDIELGHWTKKDTRKLAASVNMERFYRLVYTPASSDLHGTWLSLKHSSLCRCAEPLHRFHRLPTYMEPLAYLGTVNAASEILKHTFNVGQQVLGLPEPPNVELLSDSLKDETESVEL